MLDNMFIVKYIPLGYFWGQGLENTSDPRRAKMYSSNEIGSSIEVTGDSADLQIARVGSSYSTMRVGSNHYNSEVKRCDNSL